MFHKSTKGRIVRADGSTFMEFEAEVVIHVGHPGEIRSSAVSNKMHDEFNREEEFSVVLDGPPKMTLVNCQIEKTEAFLYFGFSR